jgi:RNA recognition motif-containing protein
VYSYDQFPIFASRRYCSQVEELDDMDNNNKLFVGNLAYTVSEADLRELFSPYGEVTSASVPVDRESNRPRGFAFIEMSSQAGAEAAIKALDGHELSGRNLKVNISQPKPRRDRY